MKELRDKIYCFAQYQLDPTRRLLLCAEKRVALNAKAFDLLVALVEHGGQVMSKDELMNRVWQEQFVEEANLAVQVSALRRVLGKTPDEQPFIVTVPGRGYSFVAEVRAEEAQANVIVESQTTSQIVIEEEIVIAEPARVNETTCLSPAASGSEELRSVVLESNHKTEQPHSAAALVQLSVPQKPTLLNRRQLIWSIALIVLAIGVIAAIQLFPSRKQNGQETAQLTSPKQIKSIAVLPLKPLVADSRDESLELGMADTLIARLSNIREINVRPISAVRKYAGLEQDALAAGKEQKVDAVVDGQIQKSGDKIRVTVRMMRIEDGVPLWTSQFDEKMTDIFAVQDSISKRIAEVLVAKLSAEERERLAKSYTENTEAYHLYLLGRYHLNRLTDDGFLKSLDYFQQAIEKDPNFALAYAGVAYSYNALGGFNVRPPKEVYPKAKSAAVTALNLDPLLAQVHTELAMVNLTYDWDWSAAEKEFKRAIEINPSDSDAHYYYAYYFAFMGQFDNAIAEIRKAQELDPVSLVKLTGVAQILLMGRRYDEAIKECRKALEMDPNLGFAHWLLGLAYMYKGSYEPAILALQKSIPLSADSPDEPASLAHAYALSGKRMEARKILEELKQQAKRKYISPGTMADLYGVLGEKDEAFALLDKAYDERDNMVVLLKVEPMYDPLRSDPRFANLLRRVGFPP